MNYVNTQWVSVLGQLANRRPIFHSEADFQHELAWLIQETNPNADLRLELPFPGQERGAIDIEVASDDSKLAIELKYRTKRGEAVADREHFRLKNHSAQDIGRYDFLKDVQRLEKVVAHGNHQRGLAIFLTNEPGYWGGPKRANTVDAEFNLKDGRQVSGSLAWGKHASDGTKKSREAPIDLRGRYDLQWRPYSQPDGGCGEFRYLLLEVSP